MRREKLEKQVAEILARENLTEREVIAYVRSASTGELKAFLEVWK